MSELLQAPGPRPSLLLGNEAIVRGALEAGLAFATCYPGTPSSEIPDTLYRLKKTQPDQAGYYFEYSTNEKVALEVAAGAAATGMNTLCTMKHVGLNVAADPLMTLAYVGCKGGMVILTADDPSAFSSQNEQDNRFYARLSGLPMLEPDGPAQAHAMTKAAFELSRRLGTPVLLRTTTRVNHARGPVQMGPLAEPQKGEGFQKNPFQYVVVPAVARKLHLRLLNLEASLKTESEASPFNRVEGQGKVGIVTSGVAAAYVRDALDDLGAWDQVRLLSLGFTWPLPEKLMAEFMSGLETVLVVEELEPILEDAVRLVIQRHGLSCRVVGKVPGAVPQVTVDVAPTEEFTRAYEYTPRLVRQTIADTFGLTAPAKPRLDLSDLPALPGRPPNLCAGCPHRATYHAVKEVVGAGGVFPTDIGCYTLGMLPPIQMADFLICMGSSVSSSCGLAAGTDKKVVAFIGDSTFFHSGLTGLVNAVHNNHDITLVILDNGTTAMTGHQPHPGVDTAAIGDVTTHVDIEGVCRGLGVKMVSTIKPLKTKQAQEAIREAVEYKGVSVVISQELCPLYAKRVAPSNKKPYQVDTAKCKNHRDCIDKIACPAFYLDGDQPRINAAQCIGCALCVQICPENAIRPVKGA